MNKGKKAQDEEVTNARLGNNQLKSMFASVLDPLLPTPGIFVSLRMQFAGADPGFGQGGGPSF